MPKYPKRHGRHTRKTWIGEVAAAAPVLLARPALIASMIGPVVPYLFGDATLPAMAGVTGVMFLAAIGITLRWGTPQLAGARSSAISPMWSPERMGPGQEFTDTESFTLFRFKKDAILSLVHHLRIPAWFRTKSRCVFDGRFMLCLLLLTLASPHRFSDIHRIMGGQSRVDLHPKAAQKARSVKSRGQYLWRGLRSARCLSVVLSVTRDLKFTWTLRCLPGSILKVSPSSGCHRKAVWCSCSRVLQSRY